MPPQLLTDPMRCEQLTRVRLARNRAANVAKVCSAEAATLENFRRSQVGQKRRFVGKMQGSCGAGCEVADGSGEGRGATDHLRTVRV